LRSPEQSSRSARSGRGEGEREGKSHLARFINFTGTRELFKLQRPDQPRSSPISLVSPTSPPPRRAASVSFPGLPVRVIRLTTRRGGDNYYAGGNARQPPLIRFIRPIAACKDAKDASLAFSAVQSERACSGRSCTALMQRDTRRVESYFGVYGGFPRDSGENHKSCRETAKVSSCARRCRASVSRMRARCA